ncbi:MAG: Rid family detoxifying hydrolase [Sodaliphilus pleomorphus]|jgi:2-iminobutanoate/2-iminopropanoate deaminase|uniref:Reactive intermediate/imine deaminase n=1 Tax=Sodaliphilus pleomorphus TaxID=2606626 RepID=A0A6L5XFK6_9BACT|nr:Rid family detoxifying hydrolase [Sodaliphilus pleomorphus]MCI5979619.1 Rid family detoxifying hydrolase [Muribaculaceae bacterium]MDY6251614.1 Rid family detoxifying hydrolase [Bacteroidales bacterium]MDD6475536.1 Rid family detoxifying hydrolase [Sodaliphilus pleomorphus]MDD6687938.1 Rid family detoxifying hydrolase [Sodaliphilus pleomorphus]MDD7066047.1 Rid family detoxifying hydrolase [Sodaliphilus pleomorphus]
MKQKVIANNAPAEIGAYSNAIKVGNFVFVSGQLPVNPETGEMPRGLQAQTLQVIENVRRILADAGATLDDVVKTTVLLNEMFQFSEVNEIYAREFTAPYPARTSFAVQELPRQALVSLDVVAVIDHDE